MLHLSLPQDLRERSGFRRLGRQILARVKIKLGILGQVVLRGVPGAGPKRLQKANPSAVKVDFPLIISRCRSFWNFGTGS
jgi:PII-like signaling protein